MSNSKSTTVFSKVQRGEHGQFQAGHNGTMIHLGEQKQRQRRLVADSIDHQLWLAEHGLDGVSPDEIFAAA